MKERIHVMLEAVGTILWFIMDYCWMSKIHDFAWICAAIAGAVLFVSLISCLLYDTCRLSVRFTLISSFLWFVMNACWMFGEDTGIPIYMVLAKWVFMLAAALLAVSIILAKREKQQIDFKRLKIK